MLIAVIVGGLIPASQSEHQGQPFEDTMLQLERLNQDLRQKYRSVGMMDDFSNIVSNMIGSLQEVQSKGESMVSKINKQESRLEEVITDIEQKEKYIQRVHFEMNQIDEINERIRSELERTQIEKEEAERELKMILEKKKQAELEMAKQSHVIRQREIEEERKISKFRTLANEKEKTIEKLRDELERYEGQIRDASQSLSQLEKSEEPNEALSLFAREEVLYPSLLLSLIVNLLTGGFLVKLLLPPQIDFRVDDRESNAANSKITQLIPKLEKIDQLAEVYSDEDEGDYVDKKPEINNEIDVGDLPKGIKKKKKRRKSYIDRNLRIHKRKLNVNARD